MISRYISRGSSVFLDPSKAFDLVSHDLLFKKLVDHKLPEPIVHFLSSWCLNHKLCVRWEQSYSRSFGVSNGVWQGSVLSPILFCIYLDGLLEALCDTNVGCHWGSYFAGAVCYADDIVLLAPSASAQLICFIHGVQISNILPSYLKTPSCTILTVLCIWVTYSPLTWMIRRILSESSKILIIKPIFYFANFMLLTLSSNVILFVWSHIMVSVISFITSH